MSQSEAVAVNLLAIIAKAHKSAQGLLSQTAKLVPPIAFPTVVRNRALRRQEVAESASQTPYV